MIMIYAFDGRWSGHVAFPGGRQEEEDKDDFETAKRETMEEVFYLFFLFSIKKND